MMCAGYGLKLPAPLLRGIAMIMSSPAEIVGTCTSTPTKGIEKGLNYSANTVSELGSLSLLSADMTGTLAGNERRKQG